jgi:DNA polymerase-3 subunit delta'
VVAATAWQVDAARSTLGQRASFPHALLIHGPRGIGKHALALNFAQALLCETPRADGLACGACAGCRYAVAGQHPDLMRLELLVIDPEEDTLEVTEIISIDRVRALTEFVQLTSHRQRAKVAVIAPAERMNAAAANALAEDARGAAARDLSHPRFGRAAKDARDAALALSQARGAAAGQREARAWLTAQGVARPDVALAQAAGAPLRALAIADPAVQEERRAWLTALSAPERLSAPGLRHASTRRQGRAACAAAHALEWLIAWTADLARIAAGGHRTPEPDAAAPLEAPRDAGGAPRVVSLSSVVAAAARDVSHPLQPRLVAEAMLLDYRALF